MNTDISSFNQWIEAWNHFYDKEKELVDLDPNAALVSSVSSDGKPNAELYLLKMSAKKVSLFIQIMNHKKEKNFFIIQRDI